MNSSIAKTGAIGTGIAVILVVITLFIADAVSGPLLVETPGADAPEEVPIGGAVIFTILGGLVGIALAIGLLRAATPRRIFLIVCVVGLVLYGIMPFTAAEEVGTAIWLNVMHVVAAVPIVGMLARELPDVRT